MVPSKIVCIYRAVDTTLGMGTDRVTLTKWHRWNGMEWKMRSCKWHDFWMSLWLICCFIVIFFYIERKWPKRKLVITLPLKSKLSGKLLGYQWNYQNSKKIVEFLKISIKMKIFKTFYKPQTGTLLKETIQLLSNT